MGKFEGICTVLVVPNNQHVAYVFSKLVMSYMYESASLLKSYVSIRKAQVNSKVLYDTRHNVFGSLDYILLTRTV